MKKAKAKLYIRFGEIPENEDSAVHRGDALIRNEGGVSVWDAVKVNCHYYPILPKHPNENAIADYFNHLLYSDSKVFLVTGTEIFVEGADREPLLMDVKIIEELTNFYRGHGFYGKLKEKIIRDLIDEGIIKKEDVNKMKIHSINSSNFSKFGKIITICGSMKFYDDIIKQAECLTNQGAIVLVPFIDHSLLKGLTTDERIEMHKIIHFKRIDMCDEIYVVNKDGYIGKSVQNEIDYAQSLSKPVEYMYKMGISNYKSSKEFKYKDSLIAFYYFDKAGHDIAVNMSRDFINKGARVQFPETEESYKSKLKSCNLLYIINQAGKFDKNPLYIEYMEFCNENNINVIVIN